MRTILITGMSRGIGLATAQKFLDEGWRVIGTYLNTPGPLQHENLEMIQYDQSDSKSVAEAARKISHVVESLDALINNAGILIDPEDQVPDPVKVRKTLEVNVVGVIDLTEHLLPLLKEGSHVVNISSGYGALSEPTDDEYAPGYRISKAALNMYTKELAFRLKSKGVIVSSIRPGWVKTDMGYSIATETLTPDCEPEQAADEIYKLVDTVKETGQFWYKGEKSSW